MKIKWKVSEAPTGPYKSFQRRGWPIATFDDGSYAATLQCEDEYRPSSVKSGQHKPITVTICLHGRKEEGRGLITAKLKQHAATLDEVKSMVTAFYEKYPQHLPNKS